MTVEEAREILKSRTDFDWLKGRVMKVNLSGDRFESDLYDRDNGLGAAQRVVDAINKGETPVHDDSHDMFASFGAMISALGGGGDRGNSFPASDAEDLASGARWIPGEVTLARRRGEQVRFDQTTPNWYWELSEGSRIKHG